MNVTTKIATLNPKTVFGPEKQKGRSEKIN